MKSISATDAKKEWSYIITAGNFRFHKNIFTE